MAFTRSERRAPGRYLGRRLWRQVQSRQREQQCVQQFDPLAVVVGEDSLAQADVLRRDRDQLVFVDELERRL